MMLPLERAARWAWAVLVALATILLVSGCGSSSASSAGSSHKFLTVAIEATSLPSVGTVLVDKQGYALYMFVPDDHKKVTCTGVCAATWPPVKLPSGAVLKAGPGVKSSLLGTDPDPAGGRVVTYAGWPLYTYVGDTQAGLASGQGLDLEGGVWYVLRTSGAPEIPGSS
jgi:predicted lipoprotein with Yx(FWY)xxD motif